MIKCTIKRVEQKRSTGDKRAFPYNVIFFRSLSVYIAQLQLIFSTLLVSVHYTLILKFIYQAEEKCKAHFPIY
jgi:hypothetical protein